jgi:putative toxin-antitoxin system antitoxin component (TIGR02293 family)
MGYRVIDSDDVLSIVEAIREGLPYARFTEFARQSGLTQETIIRVMQTPKRTLARRKAQGRLRPDESERLLRLSTVFDKAVELFEGDVDGARRWLSRPAKALGGLTPLEMAESEIGAREVEDLIGRLEHGVFT